MFQAGCAIFHTKKMDFCRVDTPPLELDLCNVKMILGRGSIVAKLFPWKSTWNHGLSGYPVCVLWESGRAVVWRWHQTYRAYALPKACLGLNNSSWHVSTHRLTDSFQLVSLRLPFLPKVWVIVDVRLKPSSSSELRGEENWDTAFPIDFPYCWWKKSCTSWYMLSHYSQGFIYIYIPQVVQDFFHQQYHSLHKKFHSMKNLFELWRSWGTNSRDFCRSFFYKHGLA